MKPNHILLVARSLPFHTMGGMEMLTWDLARQFVRDGIPTSILTTDISGRPEEFEEEGVNIIALKKTTAGKYSQAWWKYSKAYFEQNLINNVAIIFSVSSAAYGLLSSQVSQKKIKTIMQAHGTSLGEIKSKWKTLSIWAIMTSLRNFYWFFVDLYYYRKFNKVIAVGETVKKDLVTFPINMFLPEAKVVVVNNGVDTDFFYPDNQARRDIRRKFGIPDDSLVCISASRLHKQKGIASSLKGFAAFLERRASLNAYYVILGEGPEENNLRKLVEKLNVQKYVKFLGKTPRTEINKYLAAADVFLFTTLRKEGLPLNILEALASGLPVILSDHLEKTMKLTNKILAVNPHNEAGIANALDYILQEKKENRVSLLNDNYTLRNCAGQCYKVFNRF